jgi:hypothetical protein
MAYEKPYAYLEPMCASENCQWCGEPYFVVSEISICDILLQIPMQGKHKSLENIVYFRSSIVCLRYHGHMSNVRYIVTESAEYYS